MSDKRQAPNDPYCFNSFILCQGCCKNSWILYVFLSELFCIHFSRCFSLNSFSVCVIPKIISSNTSEMQLFESWMHVLHVVFIISEAQSNRGTYSVCQFFWPTPGCYTWTTHMLCHVLLEIRYTQNSLISYSNRTVTKHFNRIGDEITLRTGDHLIIRLWPGPNWSA